MRLHKDAIAIALSNGILQEPLPMSVVARLANCLADPASTGVLKATREGVLVSVLPAARYTQEKLENAMRYTRARISAGIESRRHGYAKGEDEFVAASAITIGAILGTRDEDAAKRWGKVLLAINVINRFSGLSPNVRWDSAVVERLVEFSQIMTICRLRLNS